jgi:hypothetical protein
MAMRSIALGVAFVVALVAPAGARGDSLRFRFMPASGDGQLAQVPVGPDGSLGELRTGLRATPRPFTGNYKPNRLVTFRHPYTSRNVIVPMKLPEDTPRVEHISDRIRFNYGTYFVEARFLPDGGVDVLYNSGYLRTLP